jgi:hypothetical protein
MSPTTGFIGLLFEAPDEDEDDDEAWLARTAGDKQLGGRSHMEVGKRAVLYRGKLRSMTFDKGDYATAAEWLGRSTYAQVTRAHFTPQHWLLCHLGLYWSEFEFRVASPSSPAAARCAT